MIESPRITRTEDQSTALIHLTIPRDKMQDVMGPGISEVMAVVAEQGIGPTGPWFTHHLRMEPETFDFEICVPVSEPVTPAGRVRPGRLPATRVARTVYSGPYEGLGSAWSELDAWISAEGHRPRADLWERYLVGPESSGDPSAWRTELNRPLAE